MSQNSLQYLVRKPKSELSKAPLLLLLHGYGSNEKDLFSFASELPDELLIVSAQAPLSLGFDSYAWYTIHFDQNADKFSDIPEAKRSLALIDTFIEEIKENYSVDENKIFLLGFSQGAILSSAYALNHPDKTPYILALSGYLNTELIDDNLDTEKIKKLDFFVSHGTVDQVIPVDWARKTPDILTSLKVPNIFKEYPVGHGVAPQNFYDLKTWIEKRI
ncbi:alpha/beta hydrolase [Namhaeicola litoreus]|uniref:Alpha/beta hydrolase n=1 Tax=Namhaeicola litoreus TaxID=1052145 RepID=A0ABW3Y4B2_9FLAO